MKKQKTTSRREYADEINHGRCGSNLRETDQKSDTPKAFFQA